MTELNAWAAAAADEPGRQHRQHAREHHHLGDRLGKSAHHQGVRRQPGAPRVQDRAPAGGVGHLCLRRAHRGGQVPPGQRGRRLDHRRRHVLRPQHPLGRGLDRFRTEGKVSQDARHVQPRRGAEVPVVLATDRDLLRGQERKAHLRVAQRRDELQQRRLHRQGLRDADPREPDLHRHRAQDRRQQRQAPADRRRATAPTSRRPARQRTSCRRTPSPASCSSRCTTTRRTSSAV